MPRRTVVVVGLTLGAGLLALPRDAAATENVNACADAYELTQSAQKSGRLFDARIDARLCAAKCPPPLSSDCHAWEARITSQIPSFVVRARGADGSPLTVDVQVDGAQAVFTETGSIEAEPGPRRLVLRHAGARVETRVDLVAGVRNQPVDVTIAETPAPVLLPLATAERGPEAHPRPIRRLAVGRRWSRHRDVRSWRGGIHVGRGIRRPTLRELRAAMHPGTGGGRRAAVGHRRGAHGRGRRPFPYRSALARTRAGRAPVRARAGRTCIRASGLDGARVAF